MDFASEIFALKVLLRNFLTESTYSSTSQTAWYEETAENFLSKKFSIIAKV